MKNFKILSITTGLLSLWLNANSLLAIKAADLQAARAQLRHSSEPAPSGWQVGTKNQSTESKMKIGSHKESSQMPEAPVVDKATANRAKFEELFPSKSKEQLKEIGTQEVDLTSAKSTTVVAGAKGSKDDTFIDTESKKRSNEDKFLAKQQEERKKELGEISKMKAASRLTQPKTQEDRLARMKLEETTEVRKNIGAKAPEELEKAFGAKEVYQPEFVVKKSGRPIKEIIKDNKGKLAVGAVIGGLGTVGVGLIGAGVANEALSGSGQPAIDENAPLSEQGSDISFEIVPVE